LPITYLDTEGALKVLSTMEVPCMSALCLLFGCQ